MSLDSSPPTRKTGRLALSLLFSLMLGGAAGGVAGGAVTWTMLSRGIVHTSPAVAPSAPATRSAETSAAVAAPAPTSMPAPAPEARSAAPQGPSSSFVSGRSLAGTVYEQVKQSVLTVRRYGASGRAGVGTGFVIDEKGHVLTNAHVVGDASEVELRLLDGTIVSAKVVNRDSADDLALLNASFPEGKVAPAPLGDSSAIKIGDPVVAIGTPFGLQHSVTTGIISGAGRTWRGGPGGVPIRNVIQTDAPINPGNSGGPLLNALGEVIGVNTAIESDTRQWVGVSFSVPINTAKRVLPSLMSGEKIERPWMGISGVSVTPTMANDLKLPAQSGVLIEEVLPNSPASKAGLRGAPGGGSLPGSGPRGGGDLITAIDDQPIADMDSVSSQLDDRKPGDGIKVRVLRDGKPLDVQVTLGPWPSRLS